ncbi:hypothetical protein M758_5G017400 [Ceratodon purpureus]|nr:hypothetical protein M758_5G017400 [Ceratodon purpureus]
MIIFNNDFNTITYELDNIFIYFVAISSTLFLQLLESIHLQSWKKSRAQHRSVHILARKPSSNICKLSSFLCNRPIQSLTFISQS